MRVLSFGEVLWDVYPDNKYIGGAPLNFAAHLARHGEEVLMLSSVGNDSLGEETRKAIKDFGISDRYVSVADGKKTGQCLVTLDENSVPTYDLLNDVAYDHIDSDVVDKETDLLYFGTLALRSEHNLKSLKKLIDRSDFEDIFVDINIRPPYFSKETVNFAVENATILKISDEEMYTVGELLRISAEDHKVFARTLSARFKNLKCIIITLGSKGAYALQKNGSNEFFCPGEKVDAVSTVGAGDSFSAAFMHKYMLGSSIDSCLTYASKIAGFVVSNYGAVPEYNADDFR